MSYTKINKIIINEYFENIICLFKMEFLFPIVCILIFS